MTKAAGRKAAPDKSEDARAKPAAKAYPEAESLEQAHELLKGGAAKVRCTGVVLAEQLQNGSEKKGLPPLEFLDKTTAIDAGVAISLYLFGPLED